MASLADDLPRGTLAEWQALAEQAVPDDAALESLSRQTLDGLRIDALYHALPDHALPDGDAPSLPQPASSSAAGPTGIDNRLSVRSGTSELVRQQILTGLEGGITSLDLCLDPGAADHESMVLAPDDLPDLLADVHLDMAPISVHGAERFDEVSGALFECWDSRDVPTASVQGALNADPFATLLRQGCLLEGIDHQLTRMAELVRAVDDRYPNVTSVSVDSAIHHNAGASPRLETVAAIATASHYVNALINAGMEPTCCARSIVFEMAVDADYLMSIVKLRSLRRLWQHVLESLGVSDRRVRIVASTSTRRQACREPWMNHLRHVSGAMAAMAGGADTLRALPHNRVDGRWLDDEHDLGDRMARNIALILQEESRLYAVHDPMHGAYAAETLTHELCGLVWQDLRELQADGGFLPALLNGHWQQRLTALNDQRQSALAAGDTVMVGVNRFVLEGAPALDQPESRSASAPAEQKAALTTTPLRPWRDAHPLESQPARHPETPPA